MSLNKSLATPKRRRKKHHRKYFFIVHSGQEYKKKQIALCKYALLVVKADK
ncbi:hypothetical protein CSC18_2765 [Klebsiella aerogenes]|nr:hypothetical protein CSC18_2765 [Klebsiella aerogenes]